jgi:hypothetical protein
MIDDAIDLRRMWAESNEKADILLHSLKEVLNLAKEWGKNPRFYTQAESNIIGFAERAIEGFESGGLQ